MKLIAEAGATKTDWRAIFNDGTTKSLRTEGMNFTVMDPARINELTRRTVMMLNGSGENVSEMHFYAAGLLDAHSNGGVEYASDMLGAARSLFGHGKGIAAILGTGSNCCFYDGEAVSGSVRSGGFILGDEGSAACLGKLFLSDYIKNLLPEDISREFDADFHLTYQTIVENVYRKEAPSRYLGSFAPWILSRQDRSEYIRNLVDSNFRAFFSRTLKQFDTDGYSVGIVGGYAYAARDILSRLACEQGIKLLTIVESPMEGLVQYHKA